MNDHGGLSSPKPAVEAQRILAIDDDIELCKLVMHILTAAGYEIECVTSGEEGLRRCDDFQPDLIILDFSMPGMNGIEFCRQIRRTSNVPIIFLSAFSDEKTILQGFDCGAVEYIVKPFKPRILVARVRLALRIGSLMQATNTSRTYGDGYLEIDLIERRVSVNGEPVQLTGTEFAILLYLMEHAGTSCSVEEILVHVWGEEYRDAPGHVYTYVRRLRTRLERDPQAPEFIVSVHGEGYRFSG